MRKIPQGYGSKGLVAGGWTSDNDDDDGVGGGGGLSVLGCRADVLGTSVDV